MKFLLDEDVHPQCAAIATGLGLDVTSVHELARTGRSDEDQMKYAASVGRILVTRNQNDFLALCATFFSLEIGYEGILIVPWSLPNDRPVAIARALQRWADSHAGMSEMQGIVDYLH